MSRGVTAVSLHCFDSANFALAHISPLERGSCIAVVNKCKGQRLVKKLSFTGKYYNDKNSCGSCNNVWKLGLVSFFVVNKDKVNTFANMQSDNREAERSQCIT